MYTILKSPVPQRVLLESIKKMVFQIYLMSITKALYQLRQWSQKPRAFLNFVKDQALRIRLN